MNFKAITGPDPKSLVAVNLCWISSALTSDENLLGSKGGYYASIGRP